MKTQKPASSGLTATTFLTLVGLALALAPATHAATISWTGSNISSPADVSTNGTLVGAMNLNDPLARTINGVTFVADPASGNGVPLPLGSATVAYSWGVGIADNDFWAGPAPGGDANYDKALDYARNDAPLANGTVTLSGLVVGSDYEVQLWIVDTRSCCSNRVRTVDGTLAMNSGAGPHIARGVFTADAATQVINITPSVPADRPQLNLLQLRNISPVFANVPIAGLPQVSRSSVAWGDYDNDGRLDFLIQGRTNAGLFSSQLWRNTGSGFTNVTETVAPGLPQAGFSSVAWGDYDNDGRLDFLITGTTNGSTGVSQLWRNTGNGFTNVTASVAAGLPQVGFSSVAWGDYDNDGRLDFMLVGSYLAPSNHFFSELWRNTGGAFTNVPITGLPGAESGSVAWGDYDNDGRLDFLFTGEYFDDSGHFVSQLWRNMGSGFTNVTDTVAPGLPQVGYSSVAWGDYDNDGRLDFLLTGYNAINDVSQLWRNTGSGFTNVTDTVAPGLPGVRLSSVAWGDYDNDGRLDFLLTGVYYDGSFHYLSQLWRNNTPVTNAPPAAPTGLALTATTNSVMLSWNSATDDLTPATGLTYNVRAGTTPGGIDLFAGHVNATNGFRRVPAMGNAMLRHTLPLTGLTNGQTVYWSVQAVDTSFVGGPFATETSVVTIPTLFLTTNSQPSTINISWTPPTWGWHLEETPALNPAAWSNSPSGELNPTSVNTTNNSKLYRLKNE